MLNCSICGREVSEKDALKRQGETGGEEIICPYCFKQAVGIDYKTFAYRKENARQIFLAVLFCSMVTVYVFFTKGIIYGLFGALLTIIVWWFAGKAK